MDSEMTTIIGCMEFVIANKRSQNIEGVVERRVVERVVFILMLMVVIVCMDGFVEG